MTTTLPERPLGLRVRDVREHRGLDYRTAAAELGMGVGTLHRLENDGTLDPWLSTVRKVEAWLEQHGPAPLAADRMPCGHTVEEHDAHPEFWPKPDPERLEKLEDRLYAAIVLDFEGRGEAWTTDDSGDTLARAAAVVAVRELAHLLTPRS